MNAWAEELLGARARVRCKALYFNPGKDPFKDTPDHTAYLLLSTLDLCALDIVYAPPITGEAQQTEEQRVVMIDGPVGHDGAQRGPGRV